MIVISSTALNVMHLHVPVQIQLSSLACIDSKVWHCNKMTITSLYKIIERLEARKVRKWMVELWGRPCLRCDKYINNLSQVIITNDSMI